MPRPESYEVRPGCGACTHCTMDEFGDFFFCTQDGSSPPYTVNELANEDIELTTKFPDRSQRAELEAALAILEAEQTPKFEALWAWQDDHRVQAEGICREFENKNVNK